MFRSGSAAATDYLSTGFAYLICPVGEIRIAKLIRRLAVDLALPELGRELKVDYVTPIGQAQKAVQVESMARVIEGVERLSAFDRALPGLVDAEATVREIADIYNAPMDMLRVPEAVAANAVAVRARLPCLGP